MTPEFIELFWSYHELCNSGLMLSGLGPGSIAKVTQVWPLGECIMSSTRIHKPFWDPARVDGATPGTP